MKVGRNDPCPCGSGKKYKHCCYEKDSIKKELAEQPETDQAVSSAVEEESDQTTEDANAHAKQRANHKDRSRFQGDTRGGTNAFKPRATRGGQRGS